MKNLLKEKMDKQERCIGSWLTTGGTGTVEALALSGFDFIIIDTEHGPFDVESSIDMICAAKLRGMTPFVRVKDGMRSSILKMLDVGAEGLIVPNVHTVDEVKKLVEYAKYFPLGQRGVGMARTAGFGEDPYIKENGVLKYFEICNKETLLIPQCETKECLDNIKEIVSIDGVDGIFIGPFDLSVALGKPLQFSTGEFEYALMRICSIVKAAGKILMGYVGNVEDALKSFSRGYDAVSVSTDVNILITRAKEIVAQCKYNS